MKTKRASLTRKERAAMLLAQGGVCKLCGAPGPFIAEHTLPVALGNEEKPDALLCAANCAAKKTKADIRQIRKADRQAARKGQQARRARNGSRLKTKPMGKSPGFQKTLTRGFDGKVRLRERESSDSDET